MKTFETLEARTLAERTGKLNNQQVLMRFMQVQKAFGGQMVLSGVSGELRQGEVVLLQGANGSGKTTLLNILTGNLNPDAGKLELLTQETAEVFRFPQVWWQRLNPLTRFAPEQLARLGVGRTWQDIRLFSTQTLIDNVAVATPDQLGENPLGALLRRRKVKKQELLNRRQAQAKLEQFGLGERGNSSADRISLGQSKRIAIARAVQAGAKILFLDEPLAGLDASGIADVMELLSELTDREGITLVIIEHVFNIPRVLELATTVWTLAEGQITVDSAVAVTQQKTQSLFEGEFGIRRWLKSVAGEDGQIEERSFPRGAVLTLVTPSGQKPGEVLLDVEDLVVYRGKRLIIGQLEEHGRIQGLSFALRRGELAVLQAPNGWGKTTLLEAIAGLVPIHRGTIRIQGKLIEHLPPWERVRLGLSFLRSRDHVFPSLTVKEVFKLANINHIPDTTKKMLLDRKMSNLSGGEKQTVVIDTIIKDKNYSLQIWDEPFTALDGRYIKHVLIGVTALIQEKSIVIVLPNFVYI